MDLESGAQRGRLLAPFSPKVKALASPPEALTSHRLLTIRLVATTLLATVNATHCPSGESCASLNRRSRWRSSTWNGLARTGRGSSSARLRASVVAVLE